MTTCFLFSSLPDARSGNSGDEPEMNVYLIVVLILQNIFTPHVPIIFIMTCYNYITRSFCVIC